MCPPELDCIGSFPPLQRTCLTLVSLLISSSAFPLTLCIPRMLTKFTQAGTIWLSVHSGIAVISACLPTFKALLPREAESVVSGSSGKGSNASRSFASKHLLRFAAKMGSKGSSRASASAESSRERGSSDRLAPHAAGPGATRWSSETRRALALSPAAGRPGEAPLEMTRRNYSAQPRTAFHTPFKQSSLTPHS